MKFIFISISPDLRFFTGFYHNHHGEACTLSLELEEGEAVSGSLYGPRKVTTFDPVRHVRVARAVREAFAAHT